MKALFDEVSEICCKKITRQYSTSFSLGIYFLSRKFHNPIYSIYGFVRLADEIVDSFHGFDKRHLLQKFRHDCYEAIETGISLNPVLNAYQKVVNQYGIERELIDSFLESMEMDLQQAEHNSTTYEKYILGSAEVVGLMCLHVFTEGNKKLYDHLKHSAMKLGAAFQKVNFLRDLKADYLHLGRSYFPNINLSSFSATEKLTIEEDIENDFREALEGIRQLPSTSRGGVYLSYIYYKKLFYKIKNVPAEKVMTERIRISNSYKLGLMIHSLVRNQWGLLLK